MKWIRKHLNWTAVFVPIGASVLGILFVRIYLNLTGIPYIPFPDERYSLGPGYPYSFDIQAGIAFADIITIPCFGWILKQKNRSLWYLMFFLPPLVPYPVPSFTIFILGPFWLAGWIILLALRNKSA